MATVDCGNRVVVWSGQRYGPGSVEIDDEGVAEKVTDKLDKINFVDTDEVKEFLVNASRQEDQGEPNTTLESGSTATVGELAPGVIVQSPEGAVGKVGSIPVNAPQGTDWQAGSDGSEGEEGSDSEGDSPRRRRRTAQTTEESTD